MNARPLRSVAVTTPSALIAVILAALSGVVPIDDGKAGTANANAVIVIMTAYFK
jgi:hypothetical protein